MSVRFGRSGVVWPPHVCTEVPAEVKGGVRARQNDGPSAAIGAVSGPRNAQER